MRNTKSLLIVATAAALGLSACVAGRSGGGGPSFPPDRALWQSASADAKAEHARALHLALETGPENRPRAWTAADASGTVSVTATWLIEEELLCRRFTDAVTAGGGGRSADDAACWLGDGGYYLRAEPDQPVLGPAYAQADRVWQVETAASLAEVAADAGVALAALQPLNPLPPEPLQPGTLILLP